MNIHLNIYLNIQHHLKWREYYLNIHLNIYCHFKWCWVYLVIQAIHENSHKYSQGVQSPNESSNNRNNRNNSIFRNHQNNSKIE